MKTSAKLSSATFVILGFFINGAEASPVCVSLFAESAARSIPRGAISSSRLEDHIIKVGDAEFLPLMNSVSLVNYVNHGGRPKAGISPIWSAESTLRQVLSLNGPLGPWGPLGRTFGVFGRSPLSPSYWINQFFSVARQNPVMNFWLDLAASAGPVRSPLSPLKEFGPLYGDFNEGVYNVLGTPGFLGAMVLGPEGPIGGLQSSGLRGPDESGRYTDPRTGRVVDSVKVKVGETVREYRIFKFQSTEFVKRQSTNAQLDTSFAVDDDIAPGRTERFYNLTNPDAQMISFLVIPDSGTSSGVTPSANPLNFNLTVRDETGRVLLASKEISLANFVQLRASPGARLQVEVSRQGESKAGRAAYRLLVVGDPYFDLAAEGALEAPQAMPTPAR